MGPTESESRHTRIMHTVHTNTRAGAQMDGRCGFDNNKYYNINVLQVYLYRVHVCAVHLFW